MRKQGYQPHGYHRLPSPPPPQSQRQQTVDAQLRLIEHIKKAVSGCSTIEEAVRLLDNTEATLQLVK